MFFWLPILLGLIQGITEFFPVSSSGHLVLIEKIFKLNCDLNLLNVILHFATLLAVLIYYRKTLFYLICHPLCKMNKYLVIATIPAVMFVLLLHNLIENYLTSTVTLAIGFFISAIFLIVGIICSKKFTPTPLNYKNVVIMGIAQSLAIFPGLSRSGTTLSFGLMCGTEKSSAIDFSFLMSIPIIFASLVYELLYSPLETSSLGIFSLVLAFFTAFVTALICIKVIKKLSKGDKLIYFVPYLVLLGIITFFI